MRRRTILGSAGSVLSVALAGCGDLADSFDDSEDGGEENGNATESDGDDETSADGDHGESARESTDSDDDLYEDESIDGDVHIAEEVNDALSAHRHTYTWTDDPPGDECYVHVELETVGDDALETDMRARLFDEDGTELASTSYTDESSPEPGDTDVYSFSFGNCEDAAAYEIEIGGSGDEVTEGSEAEASETLIDDFEAYDGGDLRAAWTLDGGGSADVTSSAALHEESAQGLRQEGDSNVRSFPGQGLANYPADGREVSVLMRPDANTAQPWILVGMEDDVWSTETPGWRLIIDPGGSIRIARETGSGAEVLDEDTQLPSLVDETVDCRFVADSSGGFEFWIQDLDGSTLGYVSTAETEGIADEMSIGFRTTEGVDWDWLRLADDE